MQLWNNIFVNNKNMNFNATTCWNGQIERTLKSGHNLASFFDGVCEKGTCLAMNEKEREIFCYGFEFK